MIKILNQNTDPAAFESLVCDCEPYCAGLQVLAGSLLSSIISNIVNFCCCFLFFASMFALILLSFLSLYTCVCVCVCVRNMLFVTLCGWMPACVSCESVVKIALAWGEGDCVLMTIFFGTLTTSAFFLHLPQALSNTSCPRQDQQQAYNNIRFPHTHTAAQLDPYHHTLLCEPGAGGWKEIPRIALAQVWVTQTVCLQSAQNLPVSVCAWVEVICPGVCQVVRTCIWHLGQVQITSSTSAPPRNSPHCPIWWSWKKAPLRYCWNSLRRQPSFPPSSTQPAPPCSQKFQSLRIHPPTLQKKPGRSWRSAGRKWRGISWRSSESAWRSPWGRWSEIEERRRRLCFRPGWPASRSGETLSLPGTGFKRNWRRPGREVFTSMFWLKNSDPWLCASHGQNNSWFMAVRITWPKTSATQLHIIDIYIYITWLKTSNACCVC